MTRTSHNNTASNAGVMLKTSPTPPPTNIRFKNLKMLEMPEILEKSGITHAFARIGFAECIDFINDALVCCKSQETRIAVVNRGQCVT